MKLIFVGYDIDSKGYRCIDESTRKFFISRSGIFHENFTTKNHKINADVCDDFENKTIVGINDENESVNADQVRENNAIEVRNNLNDAQHTLVISINDTSGEYEPIDESKTDDDDPEHELDEKVVIENDNRTVTRHLRSTSGLSPLNLIYFEIRIGINVIWIDKIENGPLRLL